MYFKTNSYFFQNIEDAINRKFDSFFFDKNRQFNSKF